VEYLAEQTRTCQFPQAHQPRILRGASQPTIVGKRTNRIRIRTSLREVCFYPTRTSEWLFNGRVVVNSLRCLLTDHCQFDILRFGADWHSTKRNGAGSSPSGARAIISPPIPP